ncbi:dimethylamine monooxygenase subunit DmmA family protein [Pseudomonas sp. 148P]|uniref:Dimethylamine monooxygenase subunit DmmA family protein n=1 Tax=Pseudomonas ulcerans TaxID=3115852 RepID=A0ABU7HR62_9PSED|nr:MULTISPECIES: dimethylamine monooxygenase subunit DmmA family protein [unclassified Pseudomonas]MEE1923065.1 dimethylamine monooxygenase subunit DmmA family protein [Pseudomonas sp. 147P]MEE1934027.1 dimethylamine monooxygenase subunit DmmA family protein [Pseudomonas sp. 148P]
MLITGIKSRPVYDRLQPMTGGQRHLVAGQGSGGAAMLRLIADMSAEQRQHSTLLYSTESFSGHNHLSELLEVQADGLEVYASNQALIAALRERLGAAQMGLRLYLSGSESFIGTAMQAANAVDLNRDEVLREHSGTLVRRVWCAHCDTYTENVTHRVFTCPGCQLDLVVRDHYSRRLAAFQGIKADGEVPGEMPAAEELDT